jgi:hypothetical protein
MYALALPFPAEEVQSDLKILDMSAGNRAMWFNKDNPLTTYLDRRESVKPTICCDTREMPSEVGEGYGLIVFDPPHVNFGKNAEMSKTYGYHTTDEIRDIIKRSAKEAHRVSKPDALMAFKWNDHDQKLEKVLALMTEWWEPLFGQLVAQRTKHACGTYWVMLRRKAIS